MLHTTSSYATVVKIRIGEVILIGKERERRDNLVLFLRQQMSWFPLFDQELNEDGSQYLCSELNKE